MPAKYRDNPYGNFNFVIEIQGISDDGRAVKGSFVEASGLEVEVTPIEYRNGSEDITLRKIPGLKKYSNIVLKRGVVGDLAFWNWILKAMKGQVQRAQGSVVLLNENRDEVMRWNFREGWPSKYTGPALNAKDNEVAMESLEICHEGLEIDGQT